MDLWRFGFACALLARIATPAVAQGTASEALPQPAARTVETSTVVIPALLPVSVEILADLSSKSSQPGARFPIRLAQPIRVEGREIVPVGAMGEGEVVHAKKSGGMGAAGELVLAVRYIEHAGLRIGLRSLKLTPLGRSSVNTVNAINVGSAASPLPIGLVGFFISGGQAVVPAGTIAEAKVAQNVPAPIKPDAPPAEALAAPLPVTNQEPKEGKLP